MQRQQERMLGLVTRVAVLLYIESCKFIILQQSFVQCSDFTLYNRQKWQVNSYQHTLSKIPFKILRVPCMIQHGLARFLGKIYSYRTLSGIKQVHERSIHNQLERFAKTYLIISNRHDLARSIHDSQNKISQDISLVIPGRKLMPDLSMV